MVSRHWVLFYLKNDLDLARLAITITRRYGIAAHRNFFRRSVREKFRLNCTNFKGFDCHFVAKQRPASLTKNKYKKELSEDFERLISRFDSSLSKNSLSHSVQSGSSV